MKKILLLIGLFAALFTDAMARPQYAILQGFGTKCNSCHVSPNTGMNRTNSGYMSRSSISLIKPESIGLGSAFDSLANYKSFLDEKITVGMDFRYQTARWNSPKSVSVQDPFDPTQSSSYVVNKYTTKRDYMVMLLQPYVSATICEGLQVNASYNLAYDIQDKKYPGQQAYTASVTYQPSVHFPSLTVGFIQPVIGTDYDDHTLMVRQMVLNSSTPPILDCDYIELGAQLDYEPISWLDLTFGVYDAKNLGQIQTDYVNDKTLSTMGKAVFHLPKILGMTSYCGVTEFINGRLKTDDGVYFDSKYFSASNVFFHFGLGDKFAIMTDFMHTDGLNKLTGTATTTNNFTLEGNYQIIEPIIGYLRYEHGNTTGAAAQGSPDGSGEYNAKRYTIGAKVFLLPSVALLPEYKIYDRDYVSGYSSQFDCQLHIFF